jgi:indole-3-glycerol phosphate synthase
MLKEIIKNKKEELEEKKRILSLNEIKKKLNRLDKTRDFKKALQSDANDIRIIAEIKKASPSKGIISCDFDPKKIAGEYEKHGAAAISILTDKKYFMGNESYINDVKQIVKIPLLRKDFIIDEYQVYETRLVKGDALLLIVAVLDDEQIKDYLALAKGLEMECLVEVHDEKETERALQCGSSIIGINNRDLRTFQTDIRTTFRLKTMIPDEKIVISESGISSVKDIQLLKQHGVNVFLIGEALMREDDRGRKLRSFLRNSFDS